MPKDGDSVFYVARSIFDSDVWTGDTHMAKLWVYLLGKAQFKRNSPEQGTLTTSLRRIQQDNPYLDPGGIIKRFWSIHKIVNMLEDLEKKDRIICKGTPKGTLINIVKYRDYQDLSNYKGTVKGKQRGHRRDTAGTLVSQDSSNNDTSITPKNVKNVKNDKEVKIETDHSSDPQNQEAEIDNLISLYKEKFPAHIKRYGVSAVMKMRDTIESALMEGAKLEDIGKKISAAKTGTPWEIISDKWLNKNKKEKKNYDKLIKRFSN